MSHPDIPAVPGSPGEILVPLFSFGGAALAILTLDVRDLD